MTAIMMASIGAAAFTVSPLDTTITVGNDEWFSAGSEGDFDAFGFNDALADPLNLATIGSISEDTYVDGSATPRVVSHVLYSEDTGGLSAVEDSIWFGIVGISVPDTDLTFTEIVYNGVTYVRSAADAYVSNYAGVITYWRWENVSPNGPTSGVRTFLVNL